ncbi:DNA alkylation repair protein [Candidatus Micrarchaeota archaeon]|nr:DNA alkylation repair protein [Candidatus Micrarchaeota archaeon]
MLAQLKSEMEGLSDPKKAEIAGRFFKTKKGQYGEGDVFLGIIVPVSRKIAKKYSTLSLPHIGDLLKSKIHEHRLVALLILVEKYQKSKTQEGKNEIYSFYSQNTSLVNNWDLVDLSADKIVGAHLLGKDTSVLYSLAKSTNLWERRISILSTFHFIKNGKFEDTLAISKLLLNDPHDLIHKAVGWMLREMGKRGGERELLEFLDKYHNTMPRTMLRYAIERLDAQTKRKYMNR